MSSQFDAAAALTGYGPGLIGDDNPLSAIIALMVVQADAQEGWITDANRLACDLIGWERGRPGDPRDPDVLTDTLIGKPLDVLVPPKYRKAHKLFRMAFTANPEPRTMGEGRNTPLWHKDSFADNADGLDRIMGTPVAVLIGLSAMDEHHTIAAIQPMLVGKSFALPGSDRRSVQP